MIERFIVDSSLKTMTLIRLVAFLFICSVTVGSSVENHICDLPKKLVEEIRSYQPTVERIINEVTKGNLKGKTYNSLADFVDKFGARLSGTRNLENAIDYMLNLLQDQRLDNVHGEDVEERGSRTTNRTKESQDRRLSTRSGITAEVLVVRSFDELTSFSAKARGKIVVFNQEFTTYGESVKYRSLGAIQAAKHGAVASLIRSVTPFSLYNVHTGHQSYDKNVPKIPTASITNRGEKIVMQLDIQTKKYPNAVSRNVVAEVKGEQKPEKTVLVSGHIDSWDVGVGALDDGGGAFISWNALSVLRKLNLKPKRTGRFVDRRRIRFDWSSSI
nr:unnamed protein product [Callosobruchus chinensis]